MHWCAKNIDIEGTAQGISIHPNCLQKGQRSAWNVGAARPSQPPRGVVFSWGTSRNDLRDDVRCVCFALVSIMTLAPSRIGIMAAMPQEIQAVLDTMPDAQVVQRAGRDFWLGHVHGRPVVVVLSRIGKVAAAITTTLLITEFAVSQILFTGVAGGLGADVRVGDVVVANALLQHDMDASPLFPRYELPGLGVSRLHPPKDLNDDVVRRVSEALSAHTVSTGGALSHVHLVSLGLKPARIHQGLIVSGDQFVSASADCDTLRHHLPDVLAVEMEGAAVAQVCHDFDVPYTVLRTISDRADDSAHVDFPRFINTVASPYSLAMVEAILRPDLGS